MRQGAQQGATHADNRWCTTRSARLGSRSTVALSRAAPIYIAQPQHTRGGDWSGAMLSTVSTILPTCLLAIHVHPRFANFKGVRHSHAEGLLLLGRAVTLHEGTGLRRGRHRGDSRPYSTTELQHVSNMVGFQRQAGRVPWRRRRPATPATPARPQSSSPTEVQ